jgi:hypothetical protein
MDPSYSYRRSVIWQIPKHQVWRSSYLSARITGVISRPHKAINGFLALSHRGSLQDSEVSGAWILEFSTLGTFSHPLAVIRQGRDV